MGDFSEIREGKGFPSEIKFLVPADRIGEIRSWARAQLRPDPYGGGPFGDTYRTTSLYFDTEDFDVFHRRGSYGRSKYRIRRYGEAAGVFLERKLKKGDRVTKRRSVVDEFELARLVQAEPKKGWPGHWFHRRIVARQLRVTCRINYVRTALVQANEYGTIRLTLDERAAAEPSGSLDFGSPYAGHLLTGRDAILELKYHRSTPAIFEALVQRFSLTPQPISKYRIAVTTLGLIEAREARHASAR